MDIETVAQIVGAVITFILAVMPTVAALLGKPQWVRNIKAASALWDKSTGNHGHAANLVE